jgi:hypothetical protein
MISQQNKPKVKYKKFTLFMNVRGKFKEISAKGLIFPYKIVFSNGITARSTFNLTHHLMSNYLFCYIDRTRNQLFPVEFTHFSQTALLSNKTRKEYLLTSIETGKNIVAMLPHSRNAAVKFLSEHANRDNAVFYCLESGNTLPYGQFSIKADHEVTIGGIKDTGTTVSILSFDLANQIFDNYQDHIYRQVTLRSIHMETENDVVELQISKKGQPFKKIDAALHKLPPNIDFLVSTKFGEE